jgi:WD40 repeat protein
VREYEGPSGPVAFSPDGRTLATGGGAWDKPVRVWDLSGPTPRRRATLGGPGRAVTALAFSPGGRWLAAGSGGETVWLWEAIAGCPLAEVLHAPGARFTSVAFGPDDRVLAAGSTEGGAWLWDLPPSPACRGRALRPAAPGPVSGVAFSPDARTLATGGPTVGLWDLDARPPRGASQPVGPGWEAGALAFSPDGRFLAAGLSTGALQLLDPGRGWSPERVLLVGHTRPVDSVAFAPDGSALASAGADGRVGVWDADRRTLTWSWQVPAGCGNRVAFAPDSRHLACSAAGSVYLLRIPELDAP